MQDVILYRNGRVEAGGDGAFDGLKNSRERATPRTRKQGLGAPCPHAADRGLKEGEQGFNRPSIPGSSVIVEREPDFEGNLVVGHLAVFDMAARLHHLEPADLPQGAGRTADGVLDRVLDALLRRARDLDDSVNMVRHRHPPIGQ